MIIDQPIVQLAMLLIGLGLLWSEVRSVRRKVELDRSGREMILAQHLKTLLSSALIASLGASLLMASSSLGRGLN